HLPPLRARPDLAAFIDESYRALEGRLCADAIDALARHGWPGNYRELFSVLRRLRCQHPGAAPIGVEDLPGDIAPPAPATAGRPGHDPIAAASATPPAYRLDMPRDGEDLPSGDGACGDPEADPGLRALERRAIEQALRSEEHTSELQSRENLVCRLLLEKKKWLQAALALR